MYEVHRPSQTLPDLTDLEVAADSETSGLHPDDGARVSIISVCWYDESGQGGRYGDGYHSYAFPFDQGGRAGKPGWHGAVSMFDDDPNLPLDEWVFLMRWLRQQDLVMQNAPFDCTMIKAGVEYADEPSYIRPGQETGLGCGYWRGPELIDRVVWDTQLASKEMWPTEPTSLKPTAERLRLMAGTELENREREGEQQLKEHLAKQRIVGAGARYDLADWDVIGPYADLDAQETLRLARTQRRYLEDGVDGRHGEAIRTAGRWITREHDKMRVLYAMQTRGLQFDVARCLDGAAMLTKERDRVAQTLPFSPTLPAAKRYWFGNDGSDDVRKLTPYAVTPGGAPKLDAEIVNKMVKDQVPLAREFRTWSQIDNALSKWYLAYPNMTGADGRIRTVFRQCQVRSGRTSVERFNSQAIPHDYQIKNRLPPGVDPVRSYVGAKPGHRLWSLDLAQAELRVAARWAPCPKMEAMIRNGDDLHAYTATQLFGFGPGHADWQMFRQVAKRSNFSLIFDVGPATFQATLSKFLGLEWPIERVQRIVYDWRDLFPEYRQAVYRAMGSTKRNRNVKLINGRRSWFDWRDIASDPDCHKAFNRFVQASLAELGAEWMIEIERDHPGLLVNFVHDACYLEVPFGEEWRVTAVQERGAAMFEEMFQIPGGVDVHQEAGDPFTGSLA